MVTSVVLVGDKKIFLKDSVGLAAGRSDELE
jgi:hypothetical protein